MDSPERSVAKSHPVVSFFILTFVVSYVVGIGAAIVLQFLLPASLRDSTDMFAKYGPTLSGIIMAWVVSREVGVRRLLTGLLRYRVQVGWYAFAIIVPFVLVGLSIALFSQTGGKLLPVSWNSGQVSSLLLLIPTKVVFGGGMGEELGWRGFALPQLQNRMSALRASLVIWVVWSVWHFPAFALDSNREGEMPIPMFAVFVLAVSIVLTWMFNGTRGSLLLPVLFHGSANASEQLYELLVPAPQRSAALWWLVALYGAIAIGIVMIHDRSNLSGAGRVVWSTDASDS